MQVIRKKSEGREGREGRGKEMEKKKKEQENNYCSSKYREGHAEKLAVKDGS